MSAVAAQFFTVVQGAGFYQAVHREAAHLLAPGDGKRWLDVGCGPGLLARLAHARGYEVTGIDRDRHMVHQARRLAGPGEGLHFEQGPLEALRDRPARFDVVSAASLLHVVTDRRAAVRALLDTLKPGGTLLIVETTRRMAEGTWTEAVRRAAGSGAWVLMLWLSARQKSVPVELESLCPGGWDIEAHQLLGGWVTASLVRRIGLSPQRSA